MAWSATGLPGGLSIDPGTGEIQGTLGYESAASYSVTVTADDGQQTAEATFDLDVTDTNRPPTIGDQTLPALPENGAAGTLVGTVVASDPDAGDTLTYTITGGDPGGAFDATLVSGELRVATPAALDFETTPSFALTVQVQDTGSLTDTATITVDLSDENEAPSLADATLPTLPENGAVGALVGTVAGTDPDAGDTLTYTVTGGDPAGAFDATLVNGELRVATPAALDFETTPSFAVTVQVEDAGSLTDTATITVDLSDVNEAPSLADATLPNLLEQSPVGTLVGVLAGSDPDAGDTLSYTITGGNVGGAFASPLVNGELRVATPAALDHGSHPVFTLTVQVEDAGSLVDTAAITVPLDAPPTSRPS